MTNPYRPIVAESGEKKSREKLFESRPWIVYVIPFVLFMLLTTFEPTPEGGKNSTFGWQLDYRHYPLIYTLKIVLTLAAVAWVWPGYRQFPLRLSRWAIPVGVVGVIIWVGLWKLQLEALLGLDKVLPGSGARSAFNPLAEFSDNPLWAYGFLAIRFVGLAVVVPIIEEFFLRGFVMRFVVRADWWNVPFGEVNGTALAVGTILPMMMHPAELLAAAVWFSMITLLMLKTKNIWDCVVAHAVTNLLLGIYVVWSGDWVLL